MRTLASFSNIRLLCCGVPGAGFCNSTPFTPTPQINKPLLMPELFNIIALIRTYNPYPDSKSIGSGHPLREYLSGGWTRPLSTSAKEFSPRAICSRDLWPNPSLQCGHPVWNLFAECFPQWVKAPCQTTASGLRSANFAHVLLLWKFSQNISPETGYSAQP